jgi:hypothetical protein
MIQKSPVVEVNKFYQIEKLLRKNFTVLEISEMLNVTVEDIETIDDILMFESQNCTYGNA